jgi:hypothetical protein
MVVISLMAQAVFLVAALLVSARVTVRTRSIVSGGLYLYGLFVLWAILFCVVIPAFLRALTGKPEVVDTFPEATGILPIVCLSWIPAFAFGALVGLVQRALLRLTKRGTVPRFEDYEIHVRYRNVDRMPYAAIDEFFSLVATGDSPEHAVENLRGQFDERIEWMIRSDEPIPRPGTGRAQPRFAPNDQVEAFRPFVDEFWSEILGTSYLTSFVSNKSRLSTWEQYVLGGRPALVQKVKDRYGVDITPFYDDPIPDVLVLHYSSMDG